MANQSFGSPTEAMGFLPADPPSTPLQQALESLSVNLEDELIRYRQSRAGSGASQPYSSQLKFRSKRRRQGLNLIQVPGRPAVKSQASPQPAQATPMVSGSPATSTRPQAAQQLPPPPPPNPRLHPSLPHQARPTAQTYGPQSTSGKALVHRRGGITPYQPIPDDYLESTEALLDSLPSVYDTADGYDDVDYEPSLREQLSTPLGIGALLLLLVGSAGFGYFVTSPTTANFLRENGLVQALRRSGAEPETAPQVNVIEPPADEPSADEPIIGFQGIGPDLSQDEFQELDLGRLSTLESNEATPPSSQRPINAGSPSLDAAADANTPAGETSPQAADTPSLGASTTAPDPTTSPAVNRPQATTAAAASQPSPQPVVAPLPQVRTAPPQQPVTVAPQAVPAAQPSQTPPQPVVRTAPPAAAPAAPPQPLAVNATPPPLSTPQAAPPAPLSQTAATPTAPATPATPAPITQPPPQPTPSYYVVTDYTGDQSLNTARGAVGGAYVRNFPSGAQIQMGAFSQESAARGLVQQLQGQGIPARVYTP